MGVKSVRRRMFGRGAAGVLASLVLASALAVPLASAVQEEDGLTAAGLQTQAEGVSWEAPTSAVSVNDHVVTVGSHLSATATAEMLGLNETVYPAQPSYAMNASSLSDAQMLNRLGVYGSDANSNPNPYLKNLFYNYYADASGLEKSGDASVVDTQTKAAAYVFYIDPNPTYGTPSELALRPDIVMGVSNATGQPYRLTMNYGTTNAVNHTTWGTGASTPSQPYMCVLDIRRHTNDDVLVGTWNSDGNKYEKSWYYRDGDETYDPIAVTYNRGTNAAGIDYAVENANELAWRAKLAMQQDASKTGRYGDPLAVANDYERFVKALKWDILSKQKSGSLARKTVAVVARVQDGNFRLIKMNPDGDETTGFRVPEAVQDTVDDLAAKLFPDAAADVVNRDVTPAQMMQADVIVCVPPLAPSYKSSAADVRLALSAAGYSESASGYPAIFDNVVPFGTFETIGGMYDSVESAQLVGLLQGFIYPEVVDPVDAMTYYASKLLHLTDSAVPGFVKSQMAGVSLPQGLSLGSGRSVSESVAAIQKAIDEGVAYYYRNSGKAAVDAARPRIASSDALDDAYGYGVTKVRVNVPNGATFTLADSHRLLVPANADGSYTIDNDDETTLTVSRAGYRDYTRAVTGSQGTITVALSDMIATKAVAFNIPSGASVAWVKDAAGLNVNANVDGTYTIDAGTVATYAVSLAGHDDYEGAIAANSTTVTLAVSDFAPESTATTIGVPTGATLVVKDASGAVVARGANGTYKLYNGYTYTATVDHPRYETYTQTIVGGEKAKVNIRLSSMTARVGHTALTINKATVSASDINEVDAEVVQTITLGSAVKTVSAGAFKSCPNMRTVTLGANVTKIGASAFEGCVFLSKLTIPSKVTSVGASAFSGCKALKMLTLKTSKLKKAKVKNSLAGSSVKTVKVSVGNAKANKNQVKKYKKIFTKANCGVKVSVK